MRPAEGRRAARPPDSRNNEHGRVQSDHTRECQDEIHVRVPRERSQNDWEGGQENTERDEESTHHREEFHG